MARQSILTRVTAALAGRPAATQIRERLANAETAAREAERAWRIAAFAVEAGQDPTVEKEAEGSLRPARQAVARLEAVLSKVEAADAEDARAMQEAQEAPQDAALIAAYAKLPKAAREVQAAAQAYAKEWFGLLAAGDEVQAVSAVNPRARIDLLPTNASTLVALELTRVTPEHTALPPGADAWAATSRDRATITPIVDHFEALAVAVREGLARG